MIIKWNKKSVSLAVIFTVIFLFVSLYGHSGWKVIGIFDNDKKEANVSIERRAFVNGLSTDLEQLEKDLNATNTPQFVILSFDGSKSIAMWEETRDFVRQMNEKNKPLRFTYFINAVYLLSPESKFLYKGPRNQSGHSPILFSDNKEDIAIRVNEINNAVKEGNEIGSHSAGHFDGSTWSYDEWTEEFNSFNNLFSSIVKNNNDSEIDEFIFRTNDISGFRAPELGLNNYLFKVEKDFGFKYDTSGVGYANTWPTKDENGLWHIPISSISMGDGRQAIAVDYSLWQFQTNGMNSLKRDTKEWNNAVSEVEEAYSNYFYSNYRDSRAPVVVAHHFSKWNDGAYWQAMKNFAENTCGLPDVRCTTFKELVRYMDAREERIKMTKEQKDMVK